MTLPNGVHALVRRTHEDRVLQVLRERGGMTRADLAAAIGLSRTTLSEITADLLARGVISVSMATETSHRGRGRPAETITLDPAAGQYLGIDFGHRRVRIAVANAAHELIATDAAEYPADTDWAERIAVAFALADRMAAEHALHFNGVLGTGIGFPGPFSPRLPREHSEPIDEARRAAARQLTEAFTERFQAPVVLDNNTRLAALAEAAWDASADVNHLLYIRLSDGVGGGLVVGGRLVTGATGLAGELGHMTVPGHSVNCRCGKRGCLETVASIGAILARCETEGIAADSIEQLTAAAARQDPVALAALREAGEAVGKVLGALAVALNPSDIVIGGEIAQVADVVVEQASATVAYELLPVGQYQPRIRSATLGDRGGAIGGIIAVLKSSPLLAGYETAAAAPAAADTRLRRSNA